MVRLFALLFSTLPLLALDSSILSKEKASLVDKNYQKNAYESAKLRDSWLNPIALTYTIDKNDQFDTIATTKTFRVGITQPIFKSGAIYFGIKYAQFSEAFNTLSIKEQELLLIKQAFETLLDLRSNALQQERQKLLIANASLDVQRKQDQYLSGFLDSGFLDNAIVAQNQSELVLVDLQNQRELLLEAFRNLSDKEPKSLALPMLSLIDKEHFLANDITLKKLSASKEQMEFQKLGTIAKYFLNASLSASYVNQANEGSFFFKDSEFNYHNYGLTLSMPLLDINIFRDIESKRVDFLKASLELQDAKKTEANLFASTLNRIKKFDKKIELAHKNEKLYAKLYEYTSEQVLAGEKTTLDAKTMQNSQNIAKLEAKMYQLGRQKELLRLYAKIEHEKI